MTINELLFLSAASILFGLAILLGWRHLPGDRFQMLATVPVTRRDSGHWHGVNLTWYGLILATASSLGILFFLVLAAAAGQAMGPVLAMLLATVALCVPAARLVARVVEKKRYTFTIGGAFFCGLAAAPLIILAINFACRLLRVPQLDMQVVLAALGIGYILGEGMGRLACFSFGCCYGKPLAQCGPLLGRLLARVAVVFTGETKKAVYEGGLAGVKLVPIQGITCVLYTATALFGCHLFLHGWYRSAFLLCLLVSQIWRVLSEILRADFRGFSAFSAYQKMGLAAVVYGGAICLLLTTPALPLPDIGHGLSLLLEPALLLGLELLWLGLFVFFGRSMVTGATLSFQVHRDRI